MSVPDWPNTYGHNLFLYPWRTWVYGPWDIFVEHGHRLFGALVGVIAIALVVAVYAYDRRDWMKIAAVVALLIVIGQGMLGGMRVRMNKETLAMIHGCLGPAFFAYAVSLAVMTSRYWRREQPPVDQPQAAKLRRLSILTAALVYLQLLLGAQLRHFNADASAGFSRVILWGHLLVALAVTIHILLVGMIVWRRFRAESHWLWPSTALLAAIGVQLLLGCAAYVTHYGWPAWVNYRFAAGYTVEAGGIWQTNLTTAHVALGSLILALSVMLAVRVCRQLHRAIPAATSSQMLMGVGA